MAENKILPWAQTSTANALSDADYAADVANGGSYADGVKSGQASSKQANKTWRQATAPGSGLGQFLVDNLSVDVTDLDTPSTFSTRIANAVLKLAQISPFNQSWASATGGYKKYAIVSDSSGNYWSSTVDQNVTVPGASGANWQNLFNGYATQTWSSSQFVGRGASIYDFTPLQLGVNKVNGQVWASYTDASGNIKYAFSQPAGDYATNPALNTEITNRTNADTGLQNQINNRVLKTGDTMTGGLTIEGNTGGFIAQYNPGSPAAGSFINYPGFTSKAEGRSGEFHCQVQEHIGYKFAGLFSLRCSDGNWRYMSLPEGSRINDSAYGDVAYTADLQNYVTTATYNNDFGTSDSRVINLAYGHRIQAFQASVGNGSTAGSWITFPVAFSGTPVFCGANSCGNESDPTDTDYFCYGATATGMYVHPRSINGPANIIVIGPK